jgi:hypothetical protein
VKSISQIAGGLVIALLCGSGGYFMGNRQATARFQRGPADVPVNSPALVRRNSTPPVDPAKLRTRLDAETNALARFKMAEQQLEAWVAKDPRDALAWLASQQPSGRRDDVIRMALNQYAETDAKGAADWALHHLTGDDLNNTLIAIAEGWAQENGSEAAAWFLALPATPERDGAIENMFFSWAANEPAAALAFLESNPNTGDLTPTLRRAALAGWAKSDPQAAVASSLALSRTNNDTAQFANTLANWATMDLEGSSQWLLTNLPAGNERTAAAQELAIIFAQQSPEAGIAWLGKLSPGAERDAAASSLVAGWARSSPEEAAKWAASQSSGNLSGEAISEIAHNFLLKDAAAFQAWRTALPEGPLKTQFNQATVPGAAGEDK